MKEFFLDNPGIYYRTNEFRPGRLNLIFIHGLSGSSSAWAQYEKRFESDYNILSLDLRGHGKSFRPRDYKEYAVAKFAEDIYELLNQLQIKNPILISHSFGTLVALDFLAKHQPEIKAAVFLSPSFKSKNRGVARLVYGIFKFVIQFKLLPFRASAGGHVDYAHYRNTGDWNLRRMFADIRNTGLYSFFHSTEQSSNFDRSDFLPKINKPILILHGRKDTIFPVENSIIMAKQIPNSRLILLENADHILVLNCFESVQKAISDFIKY